jgi:hypothetical protein
MIGDTNSLWKTKLDAICTYLAQHMEVQFVFHNRHLRPRNKVHCLVT